MTIVASVSGNLGGNGELKYLQDGTAVLEMSIAARGEKPRDGGEPAPQWVRVSLFGERAKKLAEFAQKGRFVTANGRLTVRQYQGQNGAGVSVEMRVNEIEFGPQVPGAQQQNGGQQRQGQQQNGGYQGGPQQGYQNQPPQGGFQQNGPHAAGWPPQQQPMQGPPQGGPPQQQYQGNGGPPQQQGQRRQARF